ncbi:hypothetical protein DRJ04_05130 [Candidatus Aerophobetes bacterium]|uniref:Polyhydroxyalkanoate synthesis regulator n=1 Tax=Aerophobetes bacterium TaxID=2030807 RepID=A0A662DDN8_UNCAE|nr:MAG: hypothetical protein DRJ04_05130 [Candidatus Aerophobetes bacterium]
MESFLKKVLLIGMGTYALTKEKMEAFLDELSNSVDKIKEEEFLSKIIEKGEETRKELEKGIAERLQQLISRANLASREDILRLERKIDKLREDIEQKG